RKGKHYYSHFMLFPLHLCRKQIKESGMAEKALRRTDESQQPPIADRPIEINSPRRLIVFAETLKRFIAEKNLYTTIGGRAYVHVEAWQFAGAAMGIVPIVTSSERIQTTDPDEIKYRSSVELRRIDT